MIYKDYYKILGLETSRVSIEEIKTAYRTAAKKYHPDVNVGDTLAEEKIKDINEAYRTLSVPASKRKYDRTWNAQNIKKNKQSLKSKETIFDIFLGERERTNTKTGQTNPTRGEDIETEIKIGLEEAYFGADKKISFRTLDGKIKTLTVAVPKGIRDGEKIRLIGQGKEGKNGGKNGDMFIKLDKKYKELITDENCSYTW